MKRRQFLRTAGIGLATAAIAKPAIAQSMPELKWRCTASWPKSLDTIYGTVERFAKAVAAGIPPSRVVSAALNHIGQLHRARVAQGDLPATGRSRVQLATDRGDYRTQDLAAG